MNQGWGMQACIRIEYSAMRTSRWLFAFLFVALVSCNGSGCGGAKRLLVKWFSDDYKTGAGDTDLAAVFEGLDAERERIDVRLAPVWSGLDQPTDLQFVPGREAAVALSKPGVARWKDFAAGTTGVLLTLDVAEESEEGLLGLAFHPGFAENGRFYTNAVVRRAGDDFTQIAAWTVDAKTLAGARRERIVLEVEQPYQNHNAGQLAFGPDGYLYVGLGDGGWMNDPQGNGQNPATLLGSMLRIDVDRTEGKQGYAVPADNPFVGQKGFRPETWAYGLRNPWRYAFAPDGRLIVADVGQDRYEEIDLIVRGGNYGWNIREAGHCLDEDEDCPTAGLIDPFYAYPRDDGRSITGGYVYAGQAIPALRGKYVFGDFISGAMWAVGVPPVETPAAPQEAAALGKRPILISTFGQDKDGELYVADFSGGVVYKLVPAEQAP